MSEIIISKRCSTCKQTKPITKFYKCRNTKDGHHNQCKICRSNSSKKYWRIGKGKTTYERYSQNEKVKVNRRKARRKYIKTEKGKATTKRYKQNHSERTKAQIALSNAVRDGKLAPITTLQCSYCPKQAEQYHHHRGYAPEHWLDFIPACFSCHRAIPYLIV